MHKHTYTHVCIHAARGGGRRGVAAAPGPRPRHLAGAPIRVLLPPPRLALRSSTNCTYPCALPLLAQRLRSGTAGRSVFHRVSISFPCRLARLFQGSGPAFGLLVNEGKWVKSANLSERRDNVSAVSLRLHDFFAERGESSSSLPCSSQERLPSPTVSPRTCACARTLAHRTCRSSWASLPSPTVATSPAAFTAPSATSSPPSSTAARCAPARSPCPHFSPIRVLVQASVRMCSVAGLRPARPFRVLALDSLSHGGGGGGGGRTSRTAPDPRLPRSRPILTARWRSPGRPLL